MKKILVTGGTGYIGSHTVVSLMEQGFEVLVIDNLINSKVSTLDGIAAITGKRPTFIELDMKDASALDVLFSKHSDIVGVIHFAALKAVKESVEQPNLYYKNNLFALINLINVMQKHKVLNLVFSSSATVYGDSKAPFEESMSLRPALSPYGSTKKMGEEIIKDTSNANADFNAISLRYFNPIGAHPSGHIGELPNGIPNNLMPFVTQTAIGLRKELLVFGNDYDTPDGTAVRDYIHVVDLAEAHVKTIERMLEKQQKSNYEVFNIGTGKGSSVLEVIYSFERTSDVKLSYRIVGRRAGDIPAMFASTKLANEELGWTARYNLDDMTASAWNWEKKVRNLA